MIVRRWKRWKVWWWNEQVDGLAERERVAVVVRRWKRWEVR